MPEIRGVAVAGRESEGGGKSWPKPVAKRGGTSVDWLCGWDQGWVEAGREKEGRGRGRRAESRGETAGEAAVREVGGEAGWAVKKPGPAEEAG